MALLKPFDKTAALAGDPTVTASGLPVTELHEYTGGDPFTLAGVVSERIKIWDDNGVSSESSELNLYMESELASVWVNIYYDTGTLTFGISEIFPTELDALSTITDPTTYVKTIEITNETA